MSRLDHRLEPEGEVRRFEVITGAMGRRRWSADDRAQILEEALVPGAVVSKVARRHGLTPQQLFTWRRIGPTGSVRVMVATKPVDFRKGAEGLAALVRENLGADPFSGTVYVFRARRADRVKLVYFDGTGICRA